MKQINQTHLIKIGIFAILGFFAMLAFIFWLKSYDFKKYKEFTFYFQNVNGLEEKLTINAYDEMDEKYILGNDSKSTKIDDVNFSSANMINQEKETLNRNTGKKSIENLHLNARNRNAMLKKPNSRVWI